MYHNICLYVYSDPSVFNMYILHIVHMDSQFAYQVMCRLEAEEAPP